VSKPIDPNAAVDFLIAKSGEYAAAKSNCSYLEEYRKTIKAEQMIKAENDGHKTSAAQEREAYASEPYKQHLMAIHEAMEASEKLRWLLIAAQERIAVWRSMEASNRSVDRMTM
jgi:hypothetical protein